MFPVCCNNLRKEGRKKGGKERGKKRKEERKKERGGEGRRKEEKKENFRKPPADLGREVKCEGCRCSAWVGIWHVLAGSSLLPN